MTIANKVTTVALGAILFVAAIAGSAGAQDKCASSKEKATGKLAGGILGCDGKGTGKGTDTSGCDAANDPKLDAAFTKAESKGGCNTNGDAGTIKTKTHNFAAGIVSALWTDSPTADKCAGAKIGASGKKASGLLGCQAKAAAKGLPMVDPACTAKVVGKFTAAFSKAESKGGCVTTGDAGTIETTVDNYVTDIVDTLQPPMTTTSTTRQTTTSTATSTTTTTSTASSTTTTTTTASSTTTTTTIAGACNPATTHRPFSVSFAVPDSSVIVQGLTLLIDYPETQVTIPGSGSVTSVRQAIINVQTGALSSPFDLDNALREQIAGTASPLTPGRLFTINFFDCLGATPPTAADFTCTVEVATDPLGLPDTGVTCSVSAG